MFQSASISILLSLFLLAAGLSACGTDQSDNSHNDRGREETRNIRNTESIGYSGDHIADQLDAALDANDERNRRMQEAEDY